MRLRKTIVALCACIAVGAAAAQAADGEGWTIEGVKLIGLETATASKNAGSSLEFIGSALEKEIALAATEVACEGCTIDNTTSSGHSASKLKFTGVTVKMPPNCTVHSPGSAGGTVVTKALTDQVIMDPTAGSTAVFDKFFPETGTVIAELEFTGATCIFDGTVWQVNGTLTGQFVHAGDAADRTGEDLVTQSLLFNDAAQKTGGGFSYLGTSKGLAFVFRGTLNLSLSGSSIGKKFGAD